MSTVPAPDGAATGQALRTHPSELRTTEVSRAPDPIGARSRQWPWIALSVVGFLLALVPLAGGMFHPTTQAKTMISDFAPFMTTEGLDGFRADLARLDDVRSATTRIDAALGTDPARYEQLARFRAQYPTIDASMTAVIDEISGARADYRRLSDLQPLDAIPYVPLGFGLVLLAIGLWGWRGARSGRRPIAAVVVGSIAAVGLIAIPLVTPLSSDAAAAGPLVSRFDSVLTQQKVREVQGYVVVLVGAVGEIDSRYLSEARAASQNSPRRAQIESDLTVVTDLSRQWPRVSSGFAALLGTMNNNLENFAGVARLNSRTESLGFGAFAALPWVLVGCGGIAALLVGAGGRGIRGRRWAWRSTPRP